MPAVAHLQHEMDGAVAVLVVDLELVGGEAGGGEEGRAGAVGGAVDELAGDAAIGLFGIDDARRLRACRLAAVGRPGAEQAEGPDRLLRRLRCLGAEQRQREQDQGERQKAAEHGEGFPDA